MFLRRLQNDLKGNDPRPPTADPRLLSMTVARVVGNVWATRKHEGLKGAKLLLVQAMNGVTGKIAGEPVLAVDKKFGAGPGDTVLLMDEGGSARQILGDDRAPVRLVICAVVDSGSVQKKTMKYH